MTFCKCRASVRAMSLPEYWAEARSYSRAARRAQKAYLSAVGVAEREAKRGRPVAARKARSKAEGWREAWREAVARAEKATARALGRNCN